MIQETFENNMKMVKSKKEIATPRRRGSIAKNGAVGKVTKVLSRPVSSAAPCVPSACNIKVVVRVRPCNDREQDDNFHKVVKVIDDQMLIFDPKEDEQPFFYHGVQQKTRDLLKKAKKDINFVFDKVFGNESSNLEVFMNSTKSLIDTLMDGYNCSVFAYGATGAGKTFTMIGNTENPGITYLTMKDLFKRKEELAVEREFELMLTYIEVYNELVKDLLNPGAPLTLREDAKYGVMIPGVKGEKINSPDDLFSLLEQGNKRRTQHPTDANAESSRSHAVFQVYVQMTMKSTREVRRAKLSMIDLAGSERGSATGFVGARFKEGANINKSLLALGNCINSLADGLRHVPYRDSKLTRLLKDSLGGNCHTIMIANVSPSSMSFDDTYNTLKYATRAKKIKSNMKRNIVNVDMHIDQYIKLVEDLQTENSTLKAENLKFKREIELLRTNETPHEQPTSSQDTQQNPSPNSQQNPSPNTRQNPSPANTRQNPSPTNTRLNLSSNGDIDLELLAKEKGGLLRERDELMKERDELRKHNEALVGAMASGVYADSDNADVLKATALQAGKLRVEVDALKVENKALLKNAPSVIATTVAPEVLEDFEKLVSEKKELMEREFQLQSCELGMSLRRELKTETKARLSNFYVHTPDKEDMRRKLNDQVDRYEKKERSTNTKLEEVRKRKSTVDQRLRELIDAYPALHADHKFARIEIDGLTYRYKSELKQKEIEILLDDHKDKCNIIENMAGLLKPLFLAVGGKDDAPESIKREYAHLVAAFNGKKSLRWEESGVPMPSDSGMSSLTSIPSDGGGEDKGGGEDNNGGRAAKRKIENDSQVSLDSTFTYNGKSPNPSSTGAPKTPISGGKTGGNTQQMVVTKGFRAPAAKRLANGVSPRSRFSPRNKMSPRGRMSPRSKENGHHARKAGVRADTARTLMNVRKVAPKALVERPRFRM